MKFAMRIEYSRYLVMDQVTFNKLTEVMSKCEVRYMNGYGSDALFTPDGDIPTIMMIKDNQLVDTLPPVVETETTS
jgi:hypothetical protein